ncbi:imidazole glycerol phosphate synthase subunit HisH [Rhodopirellula sallentina]|uniref:Imidazole glycerol phosphate synthase subunit HisH n=1 Tax=Rhodopirellula sallentina SM41 TaxID=1263870 RepID=M5UGD4_9BACT|nr:imidazole glycerol phosphate synthase subunit HisH [Rhodopirellula sallentina]EMI56901.1 imidazole glycerol phosphate synthase, glutamine amidotransferase subunit [Rhodopirellula sallentina SM41]
MITIVDYQMGNLRSVQKAVERSGVEAVITSDASEIASAEKLILPGVGAFGDAISEIRNRDLESPIKDYLAADKPFLGICLGLQMLFEQGFEHGTHEGLGVIEGDVTKFSLPLEYKVPHMGWNTVDIGPAGEDLGIAPQTHFYFVHSYYVRPTDPSVVALTCDYGGSFCAAVRRGNLFATQFHPEKSQQAGLQLVERFARGTLMPNTLSNS